MRRPPPRSVSRLGACRHRDRSGGDSGEHGGAPPGEAGAAARARVEQNRTHRAPASASSHSSSRMRRTKGAVPEGPPVPSLSERSNDIIDELLKRGIKNIWLRKGENGSGIYHANGFVSLHAPSIQVKDSTGAGDAALAGWVAASYLGKDEEQCLKAGHTLAAEVCRCTVLW